MRLVDKNALRIANDEWHVISSQQGAVSRGKFVEVVMKYSQWE